MGIHWNNSDHMGDVMIRGELNELYWLNKEVEDLQNRLQELEETNGVGSSKMVMVYIVMK